MQEGVDIQLQLCFRFIIFPRRVKGAEVYSGRDDFHPLRNIVFVALVLFVHFLMRAGADERTGLQGKFLRLDSRAD